MRCFSFLPWLSCLRSPPHEAFSQGRAVLAAGWHQSRGLSVRWRPAHLTASSDEPRLHRTEVSRRPCASHTTSWPGAAQAPASPVPRASAHLSSRRFAPRIQASLSVRSSCSLKTRFFENPCHAEEKAQPECKCKFPSQGSRFVHRSLAWLFGWRWPRCANSRLTLPSRGPAPASRVGPLMSNVRRLMPSIRIGTDSEHIKISLPASYSAEGWAQAEVEICVHGFHGRIWPLVEAIDFQLFATQLRAVYESLEGEATFNPREEQFTLKVTAKSGGHIEVTGTAWSKATYENKLSFILEVDQSFLAEPLRELEGLLPTSGRGAA
jgi:hypothetical protein